MPFPDFAACHPGYGPRPTLPASPAPPSARHAPVRLGVDPPDGVVGTPMLPRPRHVRASVVFPTPPLTLATALRPESPGRLGYIGQPGARRPLGRRRRGIECRWIEKPVATLHPPSAREGSFARRRPRRPVNGQAMRFASASVQLHLVTIRLVNEIGGAVALPCACL
jgi:hypothetical protein